MMSVAIVGTCPLLLPSILLSMRYTKAAMASPAGRKGGTVSDWWTVLKLKGTMDCKRTINVLTTVDA